MKGVRLAYLVSRYPAISNAFISREILGLRERGFDIHTASINDPELAKETLSKQDSQEATKTFYIKRKGVFGAVAATFSTLFKHPIGFLNGLFKSLQLAGLHPTALFYHLAYLAEALILGRWMESKGLSHVHVHFANPATTVALLTSKIFPITYSFTSHGPDEFFDIKGQALKEKIDGARFVVCISHYNRSQLMRISTYDQWDKFFVVYLGVDPDKFIPSHRKQSLFEVLCVGRLVPAKGQILLIRAVKALLHEGLKLNLRFIGDGPDRDFLEQWKNDHIHFEGNVNQDKIIGFYERADVFVLPSFAEGKPVVLMEAMSMEIPCLTTFVNGIPELIENKIEGLLIPPSSVEHLTSALRKLYHNATLRSVIGKAGRKKILHSYDLRKNISILAGLFEAELG